MGRLQGGGTASGADSGSGFKGGEDIDAYYFLNTPDHRNRFLLGAGFVRNLNDSPLVSFGDLAVRWLYV
jgi:hypothetical protein